MISEGDKAKCTGRILEVPVGPKPCWAAWWIPWARPIDGKGPIECGFYFTD